VIFAFSFKWYLKMKSQDFHQNLECFYKHCSEEIILFLSCSPKRQLKFKVPDCISYTNVDRFFLVLTLGLAMQVIPGHCPELLAQGGRTI